MKFSFSILLLLLGLSFTTYAGTVDTVSIFSQAMHKAIACVVIKPDSYKKKENIYPVVYLLHGYSGKYSDWIKKKPNLATLVDEHQIIIVCPDGGFSSWYLDSPIDSNYKYETFVGVEVPAFINTNYRTKKTSAFNAITGLSMGGHGAMYLALKHPTTFGAMGSMSGGVNLFSSTQKFDLSKRLGDTLSYRNNWDSNTIIQMINNHAKDSSITAIIDCGINDFFYADNALLHTKMMHLQIPHTYIERPGKHNWDYWCEAIEYQLLYFKRHFNTSINSALQK